MDDQGGLVSSRRRSASIIVVILCDLMSSWLAFLPMMGLYLLVKNYVIGPRDPTFNDDPTGVLFVFVTLLLASLFPCVISNIALRRRTLLNHWLLISLSIIILVGPPAIELVNPGLIMPLWNWVYR